MSSKAKLKISIKELVLYCITGAFMLWGLVYTILGLLARWLRLSQNSPLIVADNTIRELFGLGYLGWGLILFSVFAVAASIIMVNFAKGTDKNFEKDQRRAARLSRNRVIEAPVEAAPTEAPVEE